MWGQWGHNSETCYLLIVYPEGLNAVNSDGIEDNHLFKHMRDHNPRNQQYAKEEAKKFEKKNKPNPAKSTKKHVPSHGKNREILL